MEKIALFSVESELAVLSEAINNPDAASDIGSALDGSEFTRPAHRLVFEAIRSLQGKNREVETSLLKEELTKLGNIEAVGGTTGLLEIAGVRRSRTNWEDHLQVVIDNAKLRRLEIAAVEINELVHSVDITEADAKIEQAISKVQEIQSRNAPKSQSAMRDLVKEIFVPVDLALNGTQVNPGIPTGFSSLDAKTGGLQRGSLVLIAARPSMGKTALVGNIAVNFARSGLAVHFASLEMTRQQIGKRLVAGFGKFPTKWLDGIRLEESEYLKVADACENFYSLPLQIQDAIENVTVSKLLAGALRTKRECGRLDLIVVDYVQLMVEERRTSSSRTYELAEIVKGLKRLAKRMDCPVIALAQIGRGVESRENKRPQMSDMSDSASLENEADLVALLYRHEYYEARKDGRPENKVSEADLIISKNRFGDIGTVKLGFEPKYTRFSEVA